MPTAAFTGAASTGAKVLRHLHCCRYSLAGLPPLFALCSRYYVQSLLNMDEHALHSAWAKVRAACCWLRVPRQLLGLEYPPLLPCPDPAPA